jgi:integrase
MRTTQPITLGELAEDWLRVSREGGMLKPNTVRCYGSVAHWFVPYVGADRQVRGLTVRDMNGALAFRKNQGLAANTLNMDITILRRMFTYATEVYPRDCKKDTPLLTRRKGYTVQKVRRTRIPRDEWPALLDATTHPRDRIALALGIYLMLRHGEVTSLRLMDVDLIQGEIDTVQHKTSDAHTMPICAELDAELRRWLTFYTNECGPLSPRWFLAPAKTSPVFRGPSLQVEPHLIPTREASQLHKVVQRAMMKLDYPVKDAQGRSLHEGMHTLRRSGARAFYNQLVQDGCADALRQTQTMLHHSSSVMTELYIGVELDEQKVMDRLRGKMMFPVHHADVADLDKRRAERHAQGGGA